MTMPGGQSTLIVEPAGKSSGNVYPLFRELLAPYASTPNRLLIHADKTSAVVEIVWAAFHHGIPYVPVDVLNPSERIQSIVHRIEPTLFFVSVQTGVYREISSKTNSTELWNNTHEALIEVRHENAVDHPKELCSVLFTSGSTGIPKGVMIPRTNTVSFVEWMCKQFEIDKSSKILAVSPLHFDLSVFDVFSPLFSGASLYLPEKGFMMNPLYLAQFIFTHRINVIYATPTWYTLLLSFGKTNRFDFSHVKTLLVAGEPFKTILAENMHAVFPNAVISNLYGPTETNVCTFHSIDFAQAPAQRNGVVSIGKTCPYNEVSLNEENVLCVSGETVMLGYWPVMLTQKTYVTGDIVEKGEDGLLYYKNRADAMIKRNGYRIEPGEIEACLLRFSDIQQVAVTAGGESTPIRITAHLVGIKTSDARLKEYCLNHLPAYMLPDVFKWHEQLPTTSSGKTDYMKLKTA